MPEIAEVARCVHFLRLHLQGKKIAKVLAPDDNKLFGAVGCSGPAFEKALKDRTVVSVGSQGKYFWITFDKPPHPVIHLGMTGWVHIRGDKTAYTNYYKKMKPEEADVWPPKYWKFQLETDSDPKVEVAFTDPRRFGRIRLVDCPGDDIRKHTPLKENGPDPVNDLEVFTEEYLKGKMQARHVPIKALLLDQSHISGIGNWVADEVLYQAKVHPEQYCDSFSEAEMGRIYEAIRYVCQTAVDLLGDSDQFPQDWLFNHRWGKGDAKKGAAVHPNGEKLSFITVGGRTSCFSPERQKKTGQVTASAKEKPVEVKEEEEDSAPAKTKAKGRKAKDADIDEKPPAKKKRAVKDAGDSEKPKAAPKVKKEETPAPEPTVNGNDGTRRRSTRLRK